MIVAKFILNSREDRVSSNGKLSTLMFSAVYSSDENSENRAFWNATPSGQISLGTVKAEVADAFELGKEYYIYFATDKLT